MRAEEVIKKSVECLELCADNYSLDDFLDEQIEDRQDRARLNSLLLHYYRNRLTVEYIIGMFVNKKVTPRVKDILSIAVTLIFFQDGIRTEVVVDSAVSYGKKLFDGRTGGFINAVLRNIERKRSIIDEKLDKAPEHVKLNIPEFVSKRWKNFYSESEYKIIAEILKKPRYNIYYRYLGKDNDCEPIEGSETVTIDTYESAFHFYAHNEPGKIVRSEELKDGKIYIQDPATALATSAVKYSGGGVILDACSAPGGKTLMLAELYPESRIFAADRSANRLRRVGENIQKAGLSNVKTVVGDITKNSFRGRQYDVVFLDVPCSNSGVIRKRPDALWKLTDSHINEIIKLQLDILNAAKKLIKANGKLVYSTCSIEYDENEGQIKDFLENNSDFSLEFQKQLLPAEHNDGAYVAVMQKK